MLLQLPRRLGGAAPVTKQHPKAGLQPNTAGAGGMGVTWGSETREWNWESEE